MALPTTVVARTGFNGHNPPHLIGGAVYVVSLGTGANPLYRMFKATDPTSSFAEVDAGGAGSPITSDNGNIGISSVNDGQIIHVVSWGNSATNVPKYTQFDTSTDTWGTVDTISPSWGSATTNHWASIAVRSDGDVIIVHAGSTDRVMGGDKQRVDYARNLGGGWVFGIGLDAGGDIHYGNPNCVLGVDNDEVHIVWQYTPNTADPPTAWTNTQGITLDSSNALSTVRSYPMDTVTAMRGYQHLVAWNDGTNDVVGWHSYDSGVTYNQFNVVAEDASGDMGGVTTFDDIFGLGTNASPDWLTVFNQYYSQYPITTAFDSATGDLWSVFSGGIEPASDDRDVYYSNSTDDGATWAVPTEHLDAVTANFVAANIYTRGSDTVLAYTYDDNGTSKYNEVVISAGNKSASGGATLAPLTASGTAVHALDASGAATLAPATASGTATRRVKASGGSTLAPITASGTVTRAVKASGGATLVALTASGTATIFEPAEVASGSATLAAAVAAATAKRHVIAAGATGTFTHIVSVNNWDNTANPNITHGVTINEGDLIVAYVHCNGKPQTITADEAGWTEALNTEPDPTGETSRHALYWKIAGPSEPATYNWTITTNSWDVCLKVFRPSGGTVSIDLPAVEHIQTASSTSLVMGAANGRTIGAGALSIIAGGKDTRGGTITLDTADNSYVNAVGFTNEQITAMAHRVYADSEAITYDVTVTPTHATDDTYSVHISFVIQGGATLAPFTAAGNATKGAKTASGGATLAAATASGTAIIHRLASGDATLAPATASGTAAIRRVASGAATLNTITASGTATIRRVASGTATLAPATASGTAERIVNVESASGGATLTAATASGAAKVGSNASGSVTLAPATAAGTAVRQTDFPQASGSAILASATTTGTASITRKASGSATLATITASGTANIARIASGSANLASLTASGNATRTTKASGSATLNPITASGTATRITDFPNATGSGTLAPATASGTASIRRVASGTATLSTVTATGTASIRRIGSGTAILAPITATGTATLVRKASGNATLATFTASGTAEKIAAQETASGSSTLSAITASGIAKIRRLASGIATLAPIEGAGTAIRQVDIPTAIGNATLASITASGVASIGTVASGNATLSAILASGTARIARKASGASTLSVLTADAQTRLIRRASGAATLPTFIAAGQLVRADDGTIVRAIELDATFDIRIKLSAVFDIGKTLIGKGNPK